MSFYAALGVKNDASTTEIRRAYQQLALTCHPDKVLGKEDMFERIKGAYEVLSDESKRREYDQVLEGEHRIVIWQEVTVDALQACNSKSVETDEGDETVSYHFPCRCGEDYEVLQSEIDEGFEEFPCTGCSNYIKVLGGG
mmetsp:Transcript_27846/g.45989  ORF Transcript_27846/g.45989 Transcript_27846/m.45989 type:complete len:140 (+) Transcript_27846:338-757(+)